MTTQPDAGAPKAASVQLPEPVAAAVMPGHAFAADPPHPLSYVMRWTCTACEAAVLWAGDRIYGDATLNACDGAP